MVGSIIPYLRHLMTNNQTAQIEWRDGSIPVSTQFDDPYFSIVSGLEETRHVFLAGNELPERLADGFHVAELGFGTGLNALALALMWNAQNSGAARLKFTSFEAFPMDVKDIALALEAFPEARAIADDFLTAWGAGKRQFSIDNVDVDVIIGDARETMKAWAGVADAWFLDWFSPAKNPELWGDGLMLDVGKHTALNGTFATYTAAGFVRRALSEAGFEVRRVEGFGRKRHMSVGALRGV
jgi:tRNA U34 5-methylaminomethyl-2-thiouridine-forming methyltransferase MnmC